MRIAADNQQLNIAGVSKTVNQVNGKWYVFIKGDLGSLMKYSEFLR